MSEEKRKSPADSGYHWRVGDRHVFYIPTIHADDALYDDSNFILNIDTEELTAFQLFQLRMLESIAQSLYELADRGMPPWRK